MKRKVTKAAKRSKKQGEVTRLLDLEVDEVSLVDKPAIGEEIYVSKSVTKEGGTSMAKKKKVKKGEEETPKANAQAEGEVEETEETEGEEGEAADDSSADDSSEAEGSEGEGEEGDDEGEEGEASEEVKALKAQVKSLEQGQVTLTKSIDEVTQMLAQSMDFHDQAAQALNQVVALTMGALDMLVNMSEAEAGSEDPAEDSADSEGAGDAAEGTDAVQAAAKAVKLEIQKFHKDVEKAGAKISSSRLSILQEIATKLTALIESVVQNNKDAKKGGKKATAKKSAEHESLMSEVSELKKSLQAATDANTELKKTVDGMATKLNDIESQAGGSAGIKDEEDESDSSETEPKNKSVFAGLVPVDQIKADIRKRQELAKRR